MDDIGRIKLKEIADAIRYVNDQATDYYGNNISVCINELKSLLNPLDNSFVYYIHRDKHRCCINLPNNLTMIRDYAFYKHNVGSVIMNNEITSIGQYAFYECTYLALTSLPEGITSIGQYAFYDCMYLALTSLPGELRQIGHYTFYDCNNLALTSLPEGITSIGQYAFYNCTNLALTSLPVGITSIGNYAFNRCPSIRSITIGGPGKPVNNITFGTDVFYLCSGLTSMILYSKNGNPISKAPFGAPNATITYIDYSL